ncbi:dihydroorotate dehydrogenase [Fervidicella metallireducens AeB]|uniref:Dihydroorotate dehydrogenase n=1 Tax=Fervidicella metallireducens AeB TaxID=1403537 RepID=A0A017RX94_9CLOT|nr:magnesium transporter CorA family protein [Fervidicella metallireducens]EYE89206.1 dihydroorotate dehydrogenase [Fervidicella metallireducens AeB]
MKIYSIDSEINETTVDMVNFDSKLFYWFELTPDELEELNGRIFNFQETCIEECKSRSQMAKVEFYDDYIFLVLNSLKFEEGNVNPDEFNIFVSKKYIVTTSKEEVKIICELQNELLNYKNSVFFSTDRSPSKLLYYILDRLIHNDYEIINKLENTADVLEIQILKHPNKQFLKGLLYLRHQVHTLRRCITPLRYIGDNLLGNDNKVIDAKCIKYFQQINSKIEKLMFSLESLIQYIGLVREAFETEMANKTNELMKTFTTIAMFFSPLQLIVGIYGMNFKMPECSWQYGYLYVIVLMFAVSFILFVYFKKKKWL